jgi:hypothetical protein
VKLPGIKLIKKDSMLFKRIYDFKEVQQISAELSLLPHAVQSGQQKGTTAAGCGPKRRGRPPRKNIINNGEYIPTINENYLKKQSGRISGKRGRRKKSETTDVPEDLNPQGLSNLVDWIRKAYYYSKFLKIFRSRN